MNRSSVRVAVAGFAITSLSLAACGEAGSEGEGYPDDTITWVVPFGAGGNTDSMARAVSESMSEELGVEIVVENDEGGSGAAGSQRVQSEETDGYTVGLFTTGTLVVTPIVNGLDYSYEDFDNIGLIAQQPVLLLVGDDSDYESFEDLLSAATASPESVTIGVPGASSPQAYEIERMQPDVEFGLIPFDSNAEVMNALNGGNVDAVALNGTEEVIAQLDSGDLSALAVGEEERLDWLDDVPTFAEEGFEDLTDSGTVIGMNAPLGLPDNVREELETALGNALEDEDVQNVVGEESLTDGFIGDSELDELLSERSDLYQNLQ